MRRINSRGIAQANKHPTATLRAGVLMAALTYNASTSLSTSLKKYMKWNSRKFIVKVMELNTPLNSIQNGFKRALKSILGQLRALRKRWQTNIELFLKPSI